MVSLWGSQAERFDAGALMEMGKNTPVVLLFVGVTSNIFDGTCLCYFTVTCQLLPVN